jgi:signal transduction histidine kinase
MSDTPASEQLAFGWDLAAQLASRLAHDLSNIFTGVNGFSDLALSQLAPDHPARPYLRDVLAAGQRGIDLSQRLHLLRTCTLAAPSTAPLAPTLARAEAALRPAVPAGVNLVLEPAADLPAVALAPEPLLIMLQQLLANAVEACSGTGAVRVTAALVELTAADAAGLFGSPRSGGHVEVKIQDTGAGIPSRIRDSLLIVPMLSTKPGHRGLGLAIVFRIAHVFHCGFRLEPGPEQGTVARVCLPVA